MFYNILFLLIIILFSALILIKKLNIDNFKNLEEHKESFLKYI